MMIFLSLLISALVVILDQLFKYIAVCNLKFNGDITVIDGLLQFTYLENKGAAFGMFSNQRWFFLIATILVIVFLFYVVFFKRVSSKLFNISASLIIGGGIGNLIDRIHLGYVIDYIQLSFFPPVCNFADYCITIGTVILLIWLLFFHDKEQSKRFNYSKN